MSLRLSSRTKNAYNHGIAFCNSLKKQLPAGIASFCTNIEIHVLATIMCKSKEKKNWIMNITDIRISHPEVIYKKGALKYFAKFTGKHLCRSLSVCEFCEIFKNTYIEEHSQLATSMETKLWGNIKRKPDTLNPSPVSDSYKNQSNDLEYNGKQCSKVLSWQNNNTFRPLHCKSLDWF